MKGFGFITAEDGTDFFVHFSACGGAAPNVGDVVSFDTEPDQKTGKLKAIDVVGCTGDANAAAPQGKGKGKGKGEGKGSGSCEGTVKSFVADKGYGFILFNEQDVFVHQRDCTDGSPEKGDWVSFDVEDNGKGNG